MIKRVVFEELKKHLEKPEISLITGPRQAGKTTLMLLLKEYLEKQGKKTLFLNLDLEADRRYFESQEKLINKIKLELGSQKGFIFIDEIQRKEDAGVFLKGIYDLNLPYKLIVSGSGSLELKEKIHESLAGRKRVFDLSTLSFIEFVNFKTDYRYENKLDQFLEIEQNRAGSLLNEYIMFGGYPKVVLSKSREEKQIMIDEIYQSYFLKDISFLLNVANIDAFGSLLKIVSSQAGKLTNYSELSSTLGISLKTVKNYLWYLEKTFILRKLTPFFRNVRKEVIKAPVYYFYDLGLRNFSLGVFGRESSIKEEGFLFQNFVHNIIRDKLKNSAGTVNFWRTKDRAEVDFIVNLGEEIIPFEVKDTILKRPEIGTSLRSFIKKYSPRRVFVINLSLKDKILFEKSRIVFLPYFEFLNLNLI